MLLLAGYVLSNHSHADVEVAFDRALCIPHVYKLVVGYWGTTICLVWLAIKETDWPRHSTQPYNYISGGHMQRIPMR